MNKSFFIKVGVSFLAVALILVNTGWVPMNRIPLPDSLPKSLPSPEEVRASYQFAPTGGAIVVGTAPPILGATAAAVEGVNLGNWWATLADDNFHWGITSTATGYNANLDIGNVQLSGANAILIQTEFDLDATIPSTLVQICDWVSSVGVHHAADAQCTTGGWRNLNLNDTLITAATGIAYHWQIYNGYWDATATTRISTPLTNFVDATNRVRIRFFSTVASAGSIVHIDYLRIYAVIQPIYFASGVVQITGAAPLGNYSQTIAGIGTAQTGSDDLRFRVPGTATLVSNFHLSFTDVRTYTGANTILVRAEYSCSATGISHRPSIWNFSTSAWEDLTTASIACATADVTNAWARNNIPIANYISGGEVRIGWRGLAAGTQEIRIDLIYIMIGTTNTSGVAELTFGSTSAGVVANTQNLDMTGTLSTWNILSADESNVQTFPQYAFDSDNDATAEEASAANINFSVTAPTGSAVTGVFFAGRFMSGAAGTVQLGVRDYSGLTSVVGGWTAVGAVATTALIYTDNITAALIGSGGPVGMNLNPEDHIDTVGNLMNVRLRTTISGAAATNSIAQWDFAMVSIQWTDDPIFPSRSYQFAPTGGAIITGTAPPILGATAAAAEGVNLGSWRATLADDNFHWGITSTATGYNAHLDIGNVQLSGANAILIQTEFDLDATAPSTLVQICDWVSPTGVHAAADAQCTTGGWRNLNLNDTLITDVAPIAYHWQIYNGYWDATATTRISTPLTNFIDATNRVRIRFFSTINTTSIVHIDYLRIYAVVQPIYFASGVVQITGGAPLGNYSQTIMGIGTGQTGLDDLRFRVPGTATLVSNFYFSFMDVRTYTGANTILVRADYSCSATGITHRPSIWNFSTSAWEDLTTASIACATADATNAWARNNIPIANYVSGGEVRIGWRGLAAGTQEIRVDMIYIMIGTTNTSGVAELTFGSTSAGVVANTQNLDMTGTLSTWNILSADESNVQAFPQYAFDSDNDATAEEASAANINFSVTAPTGSAVTGVFFAGRFMSGAAGTVQLGVRDYSGLTSVVGGWTAVGAVATTALIYTDNITAALIGSGGPAGTNLNPEDHIDTVGNLMNIRLRTTISGAAATNSIAQWDFAMVSIQWTETPPIAPPAFEQSAYRWFENRDGVPAFGVDGVVAHNPSAGFDEIRSIAINAAGGFIYAAGFDTIVPGNHQWRIEKRLLSDGSLVTGFGTGGVVTSNPIGGDNAIFSIAIDTAGGFIYAAGFDTGPGNRQWRIEKRLLSTGALDTGFGTGGVVTTNPSAGIDEIRSIAINAAGGFIYAAGFDTGPGNAQWRIEKRSLTTGALITGFGTGGVVTSNPSAGSDRIFSIAINAAGGFIYAGGYDLVPGAGNAQWRIEKRSLTTGALITGFGTGGVVTTNPSAGSDVINSIAIDTAGGFIYAAGHDTVPGNIQWRIEKRLLSTGALDTGFGTGGVVTTNPSTDWDEIFSIAINAAGGFIYAGGHDTVPGNIQWRIEKRSLTTGALITGFGTGGVITSNPSGAYDVIFSIAIDTAGGFIYAGGLDNIPGNRQIRIEKRSLTTGALSTLIIDVGAPLAPQNASTTLSAAGAVFRLRQLIQVGTGSLTLNAQNFRLQFATRSGVCDTGFVGETFADITTTTVIAFHDNPVPADGAALTANANDPFITGVTTRNQTYEELNPFINSASAIAVGEAGMWDFSLRDNAAPPGTSYCFRIVRADGTLLNTYTVIAEITTSAPAQTLTFSLGTNSLALGTLSTSIVRTGSHTIIVGTNAASGMVVTFSGPTLTSGVHTIAAMPTAAPSVVGTAQFGINAVANTTPAVGAACSGTVPIAAAAVNYNTANNFRFVSGDVIVSSAGAINTTTCTISYIANISAVTAAGNYSTVLTYIATGTF